MTGVMIRRCCLIQQQLTNQFAGEAPIFEETHPLGQLPALVHLTRAKLGIVHLPEQVTPFVLIDFQIAADEISAYASLLEFRADAQRTLPFVDTALDEGLGETFIALQTRLLELIERLLQQIRIIGVFAELALQLPAGVLPGREQSDCRGLDLSRSRVAQASASTSFSSVSGCGSNSARMRPSISLEIAGFSLRKLRTFSLPWPMRSPL
jgi:hypothetical protein